MMKIRVNSALAFVMLLAMPAWSFGQAQPAAEKPDEAKLLAVLKSDAPQKEKAEACRLLSRVGTKESVPVLAGLLADEKLSHMARYGLEPIQDPSVDKAFRDALGKLKGRPLVGVIGSIGVRRDAKAVDALTALLKDDSPEVAQAAARALGSIGNVAAAKALQVRLADVPAAERLSACEGLFRCGERLAAEGQRKQAVAIYDQLRSVNDAPQQVRTGAVRGAILVHEKNQGIRILKEYLGNSDYALFAAACRASQEMPGREVTLALATAMKGLPADHQILLIQTLARRTEPAGLRVLSAAAKSGEKAVRVSAVRALAEVHNPLAVPVLEELARDSDPDLAKAAQESLNSFKPSTQPATQS